jgi:dTDP-4-dehydrorhamnose reductase
MARILVTGSNGQVGQELQVLASQFRDFQFLFTNRTELDITDKISIQRFFESNSIQYCINCAAYTAVDKAESEPEQAHLVNVKSVQYLAEACKNVGALLIHFSSDYVYHNGQNTPLKETDPTTPQSVYAKSKLEGEAAETAGTALILRTSWVYSSFGHNFVKTMLRLGRERPELRVVYDQVGAPTHARDLAQAVLHIIQKVENGIIERSLLHGIYNYSNEGVTSWYDFAKAIFEIADIDCKVTPIETKDYPTPAQRPPYSVLNKNKMKEAFGVEIAHWRESLKTCLGLL